MSHLVSEYTADWSRGQIDDVSAINFPKNAAAEITNGRIYPDMTVQRRPGTIKLHTTSLGTTVYGAIEFTRADGTVQLVEITSTKFQISTDSGVNWTDKTAANTLIAGYYSLATMRVGSTNYLYAANGATVVWRWDGTTLDTNPNAPSGVKFLAVFNGRLYYAGHSGVIVQGTKIGDPSVVASPDGLTIQIITHSGDVPTGMYQVGPHLLVFDADATSYIDGYGEQTLIVASGATGFSRSVGCIAFRTICGVGENAVCWLSKRGIEYYSPNSGIRLVSRGLQKFMRTVNRSTINETPGIPTATYDPVSLDYYCALPIAGSTNDTIVIINLLMQGTNWLGACSLDSIQAAGAGTVLYFKDTDVDGYLDVDAAGVGLRTGDQGYATLAGVGEGTVPTVQDATGYLGSSTTSSLAATLFTQKDSTRGTVVCSGGYDGFIRKHYGVNLDDMNSDSTGGLDVTLTVVSRPFLFGNPRQRKQVRAIHVATISDAAVHVTLSLRVNGATVSEHDNVSLASAVSNQPKRTKVRTYGRGDDPQVVLTSIDDVRVALLGVSAHELRESIA